MDQVIVTVVVSLFVLAMLPMVVLPLVRPEPARPTMIAPRPERKTPPTGRSAGADEPAIAA